MCIQNNLTNYKETTIAEDKLESKKRLVQMERIYVDNSMDSNKVSTSIDRSKGSIVEKKITIINSRWIPKRKIINENKAKYKAKLVIWSFKDKNACEFNRTYAPVSRLQLVRSV